jgi:hypothetical protein
MCQRERCMSCGQPDGKPLAGCAHDRLERHEHPLGHSVVEGGCTSRTTTKPLLPLAGSIYVDLTDTEAAAQFLEMVARVIREKKRLRITIE